MNQLVDAVKVTLGPKGRNVVLEKKWGAPTITNDGVSIAKEIELEDPYERVGAELVKEVAKKTDDVAGDGTTTATVLAGALVREGLRNVAAGANPMGLKRGIEAAVEAAIASLKVISRETDSKEQISQVASISAADTEIGSMIAEAIDKVGKDGVITVEESQTFGMEMDLVEGMRFDKGYISPYFVTDSERMEAVLEDPYILLFGSKITAVRDMLPVLEKVMQTGKPLVILAEDVEGEALATLVVNKIRGTFRSAAVKAPGFGERRKAMLQDIAILTGGQVITEDVGLKLENVTLDLLGRARKIVITRTRPLSSRVPVTTPTSRADQPDQGRDREHRLGLRPGEAAGAPRKALRWRRGHQGRRGHRGRVEGKEAPHRRRCLDDQGCHRRRRCPWRWRRPPAFAEGDPGPSPRSSSVTRRPVPRIVAKAVEEPLKQIAINAGLEGGVVIDKVRNLTEPAEGLKTPQLASTRTSSDTGVIDAAKVTRSALQNAASIAALFLTTEALVVDKPEEHGAPSMPGGGMDDF